MAECERDLDQLLLVVELLYKEIKGIKRRQYYREHHATRKKSIADEVNKQRYHIYGKVGRRWHGKKPMRVQFD